MALVSLLQAVDHVTRIMVAGVVDGEAGVGVIVLATNKRSNKHTRVNRQCT